jgi:hypothetical protein
MIPALKGEELVNGVDGRGVGGMNPEPTAMGKSIGGVGDQGSSLRHDSGTGHLAVVYEARQGEVSPLKGKSNRPHMAADLGGSGGVV